MAAEPEFEVQQGARRAFARQHPCPATGNTTGAFICAFDTMRQAKVFVNIRDVLPVSRPTTLP
jgi:hypothetical protein